jgi:hypothetical protein
LQRVFIGKDNGKLAEIEQKKSVAINRTRYFNKQQFNPVKCTPKIWLLMIDILHKEWQQVWIYLTAMSLVPALASNC